MKLLLHVGMSKAGSSAIQQLLHDHAPALARHGFCYPRTGIEGVHAHFGICHELIRQRATGLLSDALAECRRAGAQRAILSCEALWLLPDDLLALLADALAGTDTEVVLYLRAPHRYLPSSYRQAIRHNGTRASLSAFAAAARPRLDYPRLVRAWSARFPLRVRVYEHVQASLCGDFCALAGLPADALAPPTGPVNPTPCDGALRLMLLANRLLPARLARRVRTPLLAAERAFRFLPAIDNSPADAVARAATAAWAPAPLLAHLSAEEFRLLAPGRSATSPTPAPAALLS